RDITTATIDGESLSVFPADSFDLVVTYSVLHHIPDYARAVEEMIRVSKPGGLIYIDHERSDDFWNAHPELQTFYAQQKLYVFTKRLKRLLRPVWYVNRFRRFINPRFQAEGDIHVFPDDHIEWSVIKKIFEQNGVDVFFESTYLH